MLDITDRVSGIPLTLNKYINKFTLNKYINAYEQVIQYNIARGLLYNSQLCSQEPISRRTLYFRPRASHSYIAAA